MLQESQRLFAEDFRQRQHDGAVIAEQFAEVAARFKGATLERFASGAALVTIPNFILPKGWNRVETTIRFLALANYPFANPDCFWADENLRLAAVASRRTAHRMQFLRRS